MVVTAATDGPSSTTHRSRHHAHLLRDSFRGHGPVLKILLAGGALSAVGLTGAGAANAAGGSTVSGHPVTVQTVVAKEAKATTPPEPTAGTDADNVQSGDQTSPDKAVTVHTTAAVDTQDSSEPTTGEDTDNIQSGDQRGPKTPDTGQHR